MTLHNIVAYWLKVKIVELAEMAVARERLCKQMPVVRQWLRDHHVIESTAAHGTIVELSEAVFSVQSMPMLYNKEQLPYEIVLSQR
jgi:hypothetical protein